MMTGSVLFAGSLLTLTAVVPAAAQYQAPPVLGMRGTSSQTTMDGDKRTQTVCKTDARNNTLCSNSSWTVPPADAPPAVLSPAEKAQLARESAERERAWVERCKPEIYVDREGLSRYRYKAPNCDMQVTSKN
jgi:hypothetical protein